MTLVKAEYKNGVMTITIPKLSTPEPTAKQVKKIEVG